MYLSESQIAYFSVDLLKACKFLMRPANNNVKRDEPIYKMSEDTLTFIKSSIKA
jgi:hypothetical protein